jgi:hypothetical protein
MPAIITHQDDIPERNAVRLYGNCPFCTREWNLEISTEAYRKWQGGALVQHAMPEVSADDRELLISGVCPQCFPKEEISPGTSVHTGPDIEKNQRNLSPRERGRL